jgi:AcrR family transcriptional regulator
MSVPTAQQRREQSRADARRTILDAAESILVEVGYAGFSMRKLVQRCGYTAPTLYHYFGDKPGLIDALLEERMRLLVSELEQVPRTADRVENFRASCLAFARFGIRNPTHYQLLTQRRENEVPPPAAGEQARLMLERPLDDLAAHGMIRCGALEAARQSIWAHLHGVIALPTVRPDIDWQSNLLEQSVEAMIRAWIQPDPQGNTSDGDSPMQEIPR